MKPDTYWCNFDFVFMFLGGREVPADIVSGRSDFSSPWTSSATDAAASGQGSRSQRRLDGYCLAARQHADVAKILISSFIRNFKLEEFYNHSNQLGMSYFLLHFF
jgi:hypothetical protein